MMCGMRPLRFTLFLAVLTGLVAAAGYLWAPLVGARSPHLRLLAPALRWDVPPLKVTALAPPTPLALHPLPVRVEGSYLLNRPHPTTHEVKLRVATPTAVRATAPTEPPATPVAQRRDLRPSIAPAATAPPVLPTLPQPVVRPVTPTPGVPIPLPVAPQPVVPAAPPTPEPVPPTPQPVVPVTPPGTGSAPPVIQPVAPPAPPAPPTPAPVPAPVSEPPPATTPTPPPTTTPTPAPPPPAPAPAPEQSRPGWGKGDPNHCHTGPPGKSDAASSC
jgi:hypothetical protein